MEIRGSGELGEGAGNGDAPWGRSALHGSVVPCEMSEWESIFLELPSWPCFGD